jgi:predicted nucleic-acid-binding Zn-ribbon protein
MISGTLSPCPNCGGRNLFRSQPVSSGGGYAPDYLPKLGSFWVAGKFNLIVCKDCGLTRFFADPKATEKLSESRKWERVSV